MLPVLFEVVVPAGLGKLVAVLLVLLVAALPLAALTAYQTLFVASE